MKYFLFIFSFIFSIPLFSQDTWVQKDSVNGAPRSSAASFVMDGEGWIVGGLDIVDFTRKMYSYDVDQDDWDTELSIGGVNGSGLNRGGAIAFAIKNKAYVGLGQGNTAPFYSDLWEFDDVTQTWTQKASFIGSARRQSVAFTIDTIAYVGTGQDADGYTKDFYKYDAASNTWTQISDFGGTARKGAVGFVMGAQGYVGTGDDGIYTNDFWQYETSTDTWIEKASYPGTARTGSCGWGIFPTAFIACGYDNTFNYKKDVWEYNYFGDVWTARSDFIGGKRTNATAFVIDGIGYLGLGYDGEYLDDFYAYTPILSTDTYGIVDKLTVFPNPTTDIITISFSEILPTDAVIQIIDIRGQLVLESFSNTSTQISFDLSQQKKGTYFYRVNSENFSSPKSGKFVVQ